MFHNATGRRSRFKFRNESGTNRARIADSPSLRLRSPQHLAPTPHRDTRSSLTKLDKAPFDDEFIKNGDSSESNQKRGRVNWIRHLRHPGRCKASNYDVQLHIREARDSGSGANAPSRNDGTQYPQFNLRHALLFILPSPLRGGVGGGGPHGQSRCGYPPPQPSPARGEGDIPSRLRIF
jgi:hypothetical protein